MSSNVPLPSRQLFDFKCCQLPGILRPARRKATLLALKLIPKLRQSATRDQVLHRDPAPQTFYGRHR